MSSPSSSSQPSDLEPPESRPNRWPGAPSTWLGLTAQERGEASSLDALRNQDLGIHLYNAYALKKRAAGGVKEEDEDADEPFVAPKGWTAWPLPPDHVPREGETVGEEDSDEEYTFKRREREGPSAVLEDILVGISLKSAKERFEAREWASEDETEADVGNDNNGLMEAPDDDNEKEELVVKEPASEKGVLRPVVSADDERSREILLPTVRHTLSRLDDVLMALHHARKTCRRFASQSAPNTEDEKDSAGEEDGEKRPKGRPRKFENLPHQSKEDESDEEDRTISNTALLRMKKPGRGRKPKQYPRLAGETDQEYLVRVARIQKKPIPVFGPPRSPSVPKSPRKPYSSPRKNRAPTEEAIQNHQKRLGLRDWSEVLGSAALVGFHPDVIARATQRCADLFGESMSLRTMTEAPFGDENADTLKTYQPEEIPNFSSSTEESEDLSEDESYDSEPKRSDGFRQSKPLGHAPKFETSFCPINDCPRQTRGFNSAQRMRAHLKNWHKMEKEQIAEFEVLSDEEMDGAVHVDGFLRPDKRARRGHDRRGRKKRKGKAERAKRESTEDEQVEDELKEEAESSESEDLEEE
ncbi:hypothetical protein LSUE1_G007317 [Lachnellula suecica]|uniref:Rrn9 domain-containing protein n=1 Tax=Lachnellula suecica TaxID=602035 RepID=A0A8T9CC11_9HELO|nr:hypothetical protein LSUE1_G007317 [Lachnellula suecica]